MMAGQPLQPIKVMTKYKTSRLRQVSVSIKRHHIKQPANGVVLPLDRNFGDPELIAGSFHTKGVPTRKLFDNILPNQIILPQNELALCTGAHASAESKRSGSVSSGSSGDKPRRSKSRGRSGSYSSGEEYRTNRSRRRDKHKKSEDDKMKRRSAERRSVDYRSAEHYSRLGHEDKQSPSRGRKNKRTHSRSPSSSNDSTSRSPSPSYRSRRRSRDKVSRYKRRQSRRDSHERHPDTYPTQDEFAFGMNFHPAHGQPPHLPPEAMRIPHLSHLAYYPVRMQAPYPMRMPPPRFFGGPMYYPPRQPLPVFNNRPIPKFVTVTVTACATTYTNATALSSTDISTSVVASTTESVHKFNDPQFRTLDSPSYNKSDVMADKIVNTRETLFN